MEKHLVMYWNRKSIMLPRKYLLVTESQVSRCGSHIEKKEAGRALSETYFFKYRQGRCSRGREPDATSGRPPKVVELVDTGEPQKSFPKNSEEGQTRIFLLWGNPQK